MHDLELRLGVESRWIRGDAKWIAAAEMVRKRRYQRALDHLEGLIIARVFELGKCHMPETGESGRADVGKYWR